MQWVDNLLNQLPSSDEARTWVQKQLILPTKEQFLADQAQMWGNTPQERMMNYTNMVAGFAGKAPQLLDQAANVSRTVQTLGNNALFAARDAKAKALDSWGHSMFQGNGPPTYTEPILPPDMDIPGVAKPWTPPKMEPEVNQPRTPPDTMKEGWDHVGVDGEGTTPGTLTQAEYNAKIAAGQPPYDTVFYSPRAGIDKSGRWAGVYNNENIEDILSQLDQHQLTGQGPADLHGGTLGDAVGRRIKANLDGNYTHYYTAPEGHQVGVNLTGTTHEGLGLTEIQLGDGTKGWFPSEKIMPIEPPPSE